MGRIRWVVGLAFAILFFMPIFAHADGTSYGSGYDLQYQFLLRGFFWNTNIASPQYKATSGSYGATLDVRFKPGSGMENWGFGADFVNVPNAPRLVNTNGAVANSFNGVTGTPIQQNGVFGLVVPGTMQFGGGKIGYWFPVQNSNLRASIYGDVFVQTGGFTALGVGGELGYKFYRNWDLSGFTDVSNSTGSGFPSQTIVRYQVAVGYDIPDTSLQVFGGYRGMNYSNFNSTFVNGVIAGVGAHF